MRTILCGWVGREKQEEHILYGRAIGNNVNLLESKSSTSSLAIFLLDNLHPSHIGILNIY